MPEAQVLPHAPQWLLVVGGHREQRPSMWVPPTFIRLMIVKAPPRREPPRTV
jgi:hypothetical protein